MVIGLHSLAQLVKARLQFRYFGISVRHGNITLFHLGQDTLFKSGLKRRNLACRHLSWIWSGPGIIVDPGVFIGIRDNIGLQGLDCFGRCQNCLWRLRWCAFVFGGYQNISMAELEYPMRRRLGCLHNPHYTRSISGLPLRRKWACFPLPLGEDMDQGLFG